MKDFIWMSKKEAKCISDVLIAFAIYSYESFKTKQKLKALNSWINIQNQFEIKGIKEGNTSVSLFDKSSQINRFNVCVFKYLGNFQW